MYLVAMDTLVSFDPQRVDPSQSKRAARVVPALRRLAAAGLVQAEQKSEKNLGFV